MFAKHMGNICRACVTEMGVHIIQMGNIFRAYVIEMGAHMPGGCSTEPQDTYQNGRLNSWRKHQCFL